LSLRQGTRRKTPQVVYGEHLFPVLPPAMIVTQIQRVVTGIATMWSMYGPDEPWPDALGHSWACGFCGFKPTCPWWDAGYWKGKATVSKPASMAASYGYPKEGE
jgi:hypothetical protein